MSKEYNTESLRQMANGLYESEEELRVSRKQTLHWMAEDVLSQLDGSAAKALAESFAEADSVLAGCEKELSKIGYTLKKYAAALLEADQKAAEAIQSR